MLSVALEMASKVPKPVFGRARVEVQVPARSEDRVHLGRLGIVVALGFVIGIAWPQLAGVRLAPLAPDDSVPDKKTEVAKLELPAGEAPVAVASEQITLGDPEITGCRDANGREQKTCDAVALQDVVHPRLKTLSSCAAAEGAIGSLSIGFDFDFERSRVERVLLGKRTTLPVATAKALLDCVEREFETASLSTLKHNYVRYTAFFAVAFAPPERLQGGEAQLLEATGRATVGWELALIRESPGNDGKVKARIKSGSRVEVTGRQADWYRIKYDAKGGEGWVFKAAIGL